MVLRNIKNNHNVHPKCIDHDLGAKEDMSWNFLKRFFSLSVHEGGGSNSDKTAKNLPVSRFDVCVRASKYLSNLSSPF